VGLLPGDPPITVVSVLGQSAASGRGHILLLTDGTRRGGLLVDAVTQVARVPTTTLAGSPDGQALELVKGVVSVGGQMVLLADVGALLGEADALAGLAKAAEKAGATPPPAPGDLAGGDQGNPLGEPGGSMDELEADDVVVVRRDMAAQRGTT
jgi:hypothetical protein